MSLFRHGFLILSALILSACSGSFLTESSSTTQTIPPADDSVLIEPNFNGGSLGEAKAPTSQQGPSDTEAKQKSSFNNITTSFTNDTNAHNKALKELSKKKHIADTNFLELSERIGNAKRPPQLPMLSSLSNQDIERADEQLRLYNISTNTQIATLDSRVAKRQEASQNGDIIRIFIPTTNITLTDSLFKTQPIIGQWVRGETRIISLKEHLLFDNPRTEDVTITFSENYQLVINKQAIVTINPNKEKSTATFNVATKNNVGTIEGTLDYRIIKSK